MAVYVKGEDQNLGFGSSSLYSNTFEANILNIFNFFQKTCCSAYDSYPPYMGLSFSETYDS